MELHQIRYFAAVAREGNFTRAARSCFVSQPSLSQQILKLEDEVGQPLFHRLGRRAVLTEAGERFRARARRILREVDNAQRELADLAETSGRLSVGGIPTVVPFLMPDVLAELRQSDPGLRVELREGILGPIVDADPIGGAGSGSHLTAGSGLGPPVRAPGHGADLAGLSASDHPLAVHKEVSIESFGMNPLSSSERPAVSDTR